MFGADRAGVVALVPDLDGTGWDARIDGYLADAAQLVRIRTGADPETVSAPHAAAVRLAAAAYLVDARFQRERSDPTLTSYAEALWARFGEFVSALVADHADGVVGGAAAASASVLYGYPEPFLDWPERPY